MYADINNSNVLVDGHLSLGGSNRHEQLINQSLYDDQLQEELSVDNAHIRVVSVANSESQSSASPYKSSNKKQLIDTVVEMQSIKEYGNPISPTITSPEFAEDNYRMGAIVSADK